MTRVILITLAVVLTIMVVFGAISYFAGWTNSWADALETRYPGSDFGWLRNTGANADAATAETTDEYKAFVENEVGELVEKVLRRANAEDNMLLASKFYNASGLTKFWPMACRFWDSAIIGANGGFYDAVTVPMTRTYNNGVAMDLEGYKQQFMTEAMHEISVSYQLFDGFANYITIEALELGENREKIVIGSREDCKWLGEVASDIRSKGLFYHVVVDPSDTSGRYEAAWIDDETSRNIARVLGILDLYTPAYITTDSPKLHYHLDRIAEDNQRMPTVVDYAENREWLVLELRTKSGIVVSRLGINLDDMRIGVYDIAEPPSKPSNPSGPSNPTPPPGGSGDDPTPTPPPSRPTPTPKPVKDPSKIRTPKPGDDLTGPSDKKTEPPERKQPTPAPVPSERPRTVEDDKKPTEQKPAPTARTGGTDDCYVPGSEVRDDKKPAPEAQRASEGEREVQQEHHSGGQGTNTGSEGTAYEVPMDD